MAAPGFDGFSVALVIPALDEAETIGPVVQGFLELVDGARRPVLHRVVVGDNGSRDGTAEVARSAGAVVVEAPTRGYGNACLAAIGHLARTGVRPDIVVFADGDGAQDPADLPALLAPLTSGRADLVIGSRLARGSPGGLTVPQRYGNHLATTLLNTLYGQAASDLGPFRAVRWDTLREMRMEEPAYGWTMEMQLKAARMGARVVEVDVANLPRKGGQSKVSGTLRGVVGAGYGILRTLYTHRGFRPATADRIA